MDSTNDKSEQSRQQLRSAALEYHEFPIPGKISVNATKQLTICVVGDVSFLYDSNALWNNYLTKDFRIIIINNSGGNIFRLLNGPGKVNDFEKFFETQHHLNAKHLAAMHNIPYYFCEEQSGLEKTLETFYDDQNGRPAILEIKTDGILSAETYKAYFQFLKNNTVS